MGVITVKGRGYVSAQPDAVTLSFTTGSKARDYAECAEAVKLSAESLAQAAGATLGKLQSIAHGWDEIRLSGPAYGVVCERVSDYAVDIDPKDVSVSEDVTLVYEIVE